MHAVKYIAHTKRVRVGILRKPFAVPPSWKHMRQLDKGSSATTTTVSSHLRVADWDLNINWLHVPAAAADTFHCFELSVVTLATAITILTMIKRASVGSARRTDAFRAQQSGSKYNDHRVLSPTNRGKLGQECTLSG